jgi:hypothetical protein
VAYDPASGGRQTLLSQANTGAAFVLSLKLRGRRLCAATDGSAVEVCVPSPESQAAPDAAPRPEPLVGEDGRYEVLVDGRVYHGRIDLTSKQDGMAVMGLTAGPDGRIYGASYYNASLFRADPESGAITSLGRVAEASGEFKVAQPLSNARILLPGYHGRLFVYDLNRSWSLGPANPNPYALGHLGHGQHLAIATDRSATGLVAIATPPDYGLRGGAVTVLNERLLTWRTHARLVPEQAVSAVVFGPGGHLYAGTSLEVGSGATPERGEVHLLVLDPGSGAILRDVRPAREASAVTALVALDDHRILGGTDTGSLFEYNTRSGISRVVATLPHIRDLRWWRAEGLLIGIGWRRGLFALDPRTLAVSWIPGSPDKLLPRVGRVYCHDGTRVFRLTRR